MPFVSYVLMVVIDPSTRHVVSLFKMKGPSFLLNKLTFPGGKREEGESPEAAATREFREETGVEVPECDWRLVTYQCDSAQEMHVLVARSAQVHEARTQEMEPVRPLDLDFHLQRVSEAPQDYSPDFASLLRAALAVLGLP